MARDLFEDILVDVEMSPCQLTSRIVHATGTIRHDGINYGLSLAIAGEVIRPDRRHSLSASPFISWQLGGHVDLSLSLSATRRELPGPDPDALDESDYQQVTRASYAEPFSASGWFSVRIHWDPTNGARNDRLDAL